MVELTFLEIHKLKFKLMIDFFWNLRYSRELKIIKYSKFYEIYDFWYAWSSVLLYRFNIQLKILRFLHDKHFLFNYNILQIFQNKHSTAFESSTRLFISLVILTSIHYGDYSHPVHSSTIFSTSPTDLAILPKLGEAHLLKHFSNPFDGPPVGWIRSVVLSSLIIIILTSSSTTRSRYLPGDLVRYQPS